MLMSLVAVWIVLKQHQWLFYGLIEAGYVKCIVIVCNMSKIVFRDCLD